MFDIETLDIDSTAVVLSAAITHFNFDEDWNESPEVIFYELLERTAFVKFDVSEQVTKFKRTISNSTLEWWAKQPKLAKMKSFNPSAEFDVSVEDGFSKLREYIKENGGEEQIFWARGSLDQLAIDSLAIAAEIEPIAKYYNWRDVRTAIDLTKESGGKGYCQIPNFKQDHHVYKHDPIHDCAFDVLMLLKGL